MYLNKILVVDLPILPKENNERNLQNTLFYRIQIVIKLP